MALLHADSLSSDPSDCVRPPPPKPHKQRKVKNTESNKPHAPEKSESSSEDEMRSTTSCGDDLESESIISEKGMCILSMRKVCAYCRLDGYVWVNVLIGNSWIQMIDFFSVFYPLYVFDAFF